MSKWVRTTAAAALAALLCLGTLAPAALAANASKQWVHTDEPDFGSAAHSVQAVSDGGWIVTGFKDEMMYMQKLTETGETAWEYVFYPGLVGLGVIETKDGGFLATGQTTYLSEEEGVQAIAVKVDADGNFQWQQVYEEGYERVWTVAETADGYVMPNDIGTAASERTVLTRIGTDGQPIEQIVLHPDIGEPYSYLYTSRVASSTDGGVLASVSYDLMTAQGNYETRTHLIKLDALWEVQWQLDIRGDIMALDATRDGGFIAGLRTGQNLLGLVRISADGKAVWQHVYAPEFSRAFFQIETGDVIQSLDGGFIAVGDANATASEIAYMIKVDASGKREWEETFFSTNSSFYGIALNDRQQYALSGYNTEGQAVVIQLQTTEQPPIRVTIDGEPLVLKQEALVQNNTTLLPLRALFEGLGADVTYDADSKTIRAVRGDMTLELVLEQSVATLASGGTTRQLALAVPAQAIGGSTMVPLRFVGEAFGDQIIWHADARWVEVQTAQP